MRKIVQTIFGFYLLLALSSGVLAQNVVCATAPLGDSSNRCADTAFVQGSTSTNGSVSFKVPVSVATTANITLSGEQTIDGVTTSASRILVKNQTSGSQNGIYVSGSGAWQRATDAATAGQLIQGTQVYVTLGNLGVGTIWAISTPNPITIGSTSIAWLNEQQPGINPFAYGIKGDGVTDDTAAWAAMLAEIPNNSRIYIPTTFTSNVTGINISGKRGLAFIGSNAGPGSTGATPTIRFTGAAGGIIILCSPCADVSFSGIRLDANNLADFGFQAVWGSALTTQNVSFYRSSIDRDATNGIGRTNFIALDWCGTGTTSNCEMLSVKETNFIGSGKDSNSIGIRIGHSNSILNGIEGSFIQSFGYGEYILGSTKSTRITDNANGIDVFCQEAEGVEVSFHRTENGYQFFQGACPVFMHDNVFGTHATTSAPAWIVNGFGTTGAPTIFENNIFTSGDMLPPFGGSSSTIVSISNQYPISAVVNNRVTTLAGWIGGYQSLFDIVPSGNIINEVYNGPNASTFLKSNGTTTNQYAFQGSMQASSSSSGLSGVQGVLNGSGAGAAVMGTTTAGLGTSGSNASAAMVEAALGTMVGNGTTAYSFYAPGPVSTGTWATIYGLYLGPHKITNVTNGYGIYQAGASDMNVFAGPSIFNVPLTVAISVLNTSSAPAISSCGTGTPAVTSGSSNQGGQFTTGTGSPTACTLTFANAYPNFAYCTITPANAAAAGATVLPYMSASSKTAFTITQSAGTSAAAYNYNCQGN